LRGFRRFRGPRLPKSTWFRWAVLVLAVFYLVIRMAEVMVIEPLAIMAEHEARARGIEAVNRIVMSSLGRSVHHNDLITYQKDQSGRIAAYSVNTQFVNQVAADVAIAIHKEFGHLESEDFRVPLGILTQSAFLATKGPRIGVTLIPVGTVAIDLHQEFQGEGINQTRHRIWLRAEAKVRVILPLVSREIAVTTDLPITETVIIGPVPANFFGGSLGGISLPINPGSP